MVQSQILKVQTWLYLFVYLTNLPLSLVIFIFIDLPFFGFIKSFKNGSTNSKYRFVFVTALISLHSFTFNKKIKMPKSFILIWFENKNLNKIKNLENFVWLQRCFDFLANWKRKEWIILDLRPSSLFHRSKITVVNFSVEEMMGGATGRLFISIFSFNGNHFFGVSQVQ